MMALSVVSLVLVAEKHNWHIFQGNERVCKVINADEKTATTIAEPHKRLEIALAAKEEKCKVRKEEGEKQDTRGDDVTALFWSRCPYLLREESASTNTRRSR